MRQGQEPGHAEDPHQACPDGHDPARGAPPRREHRPMATRADRREPTSWRPRASSVTLGRQRHRGRRGGAPRGEDPVVVSSAASAPRASARRRAAVAALGRRCGSRSSRVVSSASRRSFRRAGADGLRADTRRCVEDVAGPGAGRGALERRVERGAEGVHVGGGGGHAPARELGGHVVRGAGQEVVVLAEVGVDDRDAEVGDRDRVIGADHDVGRLDVAVHDPAPVHRRQALGDLGADGRDTGGGKRGPAAPGGRPVRARPRTP